VDHDESRITLHTMTRMNTRRETGHGNVKSDERTEARLSVEIVDIALPDGYGVAKNKDLVIFVPGTVPGDMVDVVIRKKVKRFAYGEVLSLDKASVFRIEPECRHFGQCGGCTLQHLRYDRQLHLKENHLLQALRRIGSLDPAGPAVEPIVPSPHDYGYRNKVELAFGGAGGQAVLGLRERVSPFEPYQGRVIPVTKCPVFGPALEGIIPLFEAFARLHNLASYNYRNRNGFMRHLLVREAKATGEIMIILETAPGKLPDTRTLWEDLRRSVPSVSGFCRAINSQATDVIRFDGLEHLAGEAFITERIGDLAFRIYPQSFFQPSSSGAELLYRTVSGMTGIAAGDTVLGLYCGMGPIEMFLSRKVRSVTGVDSVNANIAGAIENATLNNISNCSFHAGKMERLLRRLPLKGMDLIVVDPPRGGISDEGLKLMVGLRAPKILYVSCNPATLARDLKVLGSHSYKTERIIPFDLFPHTSHMETAVLLTRKPH
jgi:23S rRNA (uracil1939-C5)-methyltransferase